MSSSAEPEHVNVKEHVSIQLSGTNYFVWKTMMLTLIKSHGLLVFITDDEDSVSSSDNDGGSAEEAGGVNSEGAREEDEKDWNRMDGVIRRWILATVNENILVNIVRLETARSMWRLLARKFSQPTFSHEPAARTATAADQENRSHGKYVISRYLPLAKAALNNDWEKAEELVKQEPDSIRANITGSSETALMIAVRSVQRIEFAKKLVAMMSADDIGLVNNSGSTALHMAAGAGNMEAAKLLVDKNPQLPYTLNHSKLLPLHEAATNGKKEMVVYLMNVTTATDAHSNPNPNPYEDQLLVLLISSGLYDIALSLVKRYPNTATSEHAPLAMLTRKYSAFPSGASFNFWQRIIYSRVPVNIENEENLHSQNGDIENASSAFISGRHKLYRLFWKVAERSVPQVKHIRDKKLVHYQAQQLSKQLVGEIVKLDYSEAVDLLKVPLTEAAVMGVYEIVEEILDMDPGAIYFTNLLDQSIFHLAVVNRREKVFNIIYQLEEHKQTFIMAPDVSLNTALHLAGRLENDQKIKLRASAAGAALQMQRELQWFKEVEKLTRGMGEKQINFDGKSASVIFSETHQDLVKEGEVWMKGTANSCAIVAALIVTVVFAAAITVPGGNNSQTGFPFFAKERDFIVFAISDVLALFSSTSSLLMFLSILTSRYAEADFLYALPKRLIIGLTTLFLSIIFMMIAFTAAVEILFGDLKSWILIPVITLASIPVTLFMSLQFSLLVDMIKSTYGSGIFGKQSDRIII